MRARSKILKLEPLMSQHNPFNAASSAWCGRTSASMIYNYFMDVAGKGASARILNQYDRTPYNLIYQDSGKVAAMTADGGSMWPGEVYTHLESAAGWEYHYILPVDQRSKIPATDEEIEAKLEALLDNLDRNNPTLFASGLSRGGNYASHFVVISGYRYDDEGRLWLQITDPATNWKIVEEVFAKDGTREQREEFVIRELEGNWGVNGKFDPKNPPSGSRYWIRAWVIFQHNPFFDSVTYWNAKPKVPLFCDNQFQAGGGWYVNTKLSTPDSAFSQTEYPIAYPIEAEGKWESWVDPDAPYPVGQNLMWHGGVHISGAQARGGRVYSIAPGEVVLVRFTKEPAPAGGAPRTDTGFVLLKHRFDASQRRVLKPIAPGSDPAKADTGKGDDVLEFYSLYMHLAPLSLHLEQDGSAKSTAPRWIRALAPQPVPEYREYLDGKKNRALLAWAADDASKTVALPLPERTIGADYDLVDRGGKVTVGGIASATVPDDGGSPNYYALPDPSAAAAQLAVWQQRLEKPTLGASANLHFFNACTREAIEVATVPLGKTQSLVIKPGRVPELDTVHEGPDGTCYVAVDGHEHPGFIVRELPGLHIDQGVVVFADDASLELYVAAATMTGPSGSPAAVLSAGTNKLRFAFPSPLAEGQTWAEPDLQPCVALTRAEYSQAGTSLQRKIAPKVPAGKTVQFYNPLTSEYIPTGVAVPEGMSLTLDTAGKKLVIVGTAGDTVFARVEYAAYLAIAPGTRYTGTSGTVLSFDESTASVKLYPDTSGEGAKRYFPDGTAVTVPRSKYQLVFEVPPGGQANTSGKDRIWPALRACVPVPRARRDEINQKLASDEQRHAREVAQRLEAGISFLMGAEIGPGKSWEFTDDGAHIRVNPEILGPARDALAQSQSPAQTAFLCPVQANGKTLSLVHVAGGTDAPAWMIAPGQDVELVPADLLRAKNGVAVAALIEVISAAPKSAKTDNGAERKRVQDENKDRAKFVQDLKKGETVDVRDRGLRVSREPIGAVGSIQKPGQASCQGGFHFEVFSGKNLVDPNTAGDNQKLGAVPNTNWMILRDESQDDLHTPAFVDRLLGELMHDPSLGLHDELLRDAIATGQVVKPDEWAAFAGEKNNAAALSRLITVHPCEWAEDYSSAVGHAEARGQHLSDEDKQAIRDEIAQYAFWKEGVQLDGLERGKPVYSYHPLRFVEWLTTGFDIEFLDAETEPGVTVQNLDDERPAEKLQRDPDTDVRLFRYRTTLGERLEYLEGELAIEGLNTSNKIIPVRIARGGLRRIQLRNPALRVTDAPEKASEIGLHFPVAPVTVAPQRWLLADGGDRFTDADVSHATFRVEAQYNFVGPTKLTVKVTSPDAFALEVVGKPDGDMACSVKPSGDGAFEITCQPLPGAKTFFERPGTVGLTVRVKQKGKIDASTKLEATVTGGDFVDTLTNDTAEVGTRTLKRSACNGAAEDIAKLSLYLSQLIDDDESDAEPCYRFAGSVDYPEVPKKGKSSVIQVDGAYGAGVAAALWRFLYRFAKRDDFSLSSVAFEGRGKGVSSGSVTRDELRSRVNAADTPTATRYAVRTSRSVAEYPVVDAAFIAEIKKRFAIPNVLPGVAFEAASNTFSAPSVRAYPVSVPAEPWNDSVLGRTALLPLDTETTIVTVKSPDMAALGGRVPVTISLAPGSAYTIVDGGAKKSELTGQALTPGCAIRLTLGFSGTVTADDAANVLTVKTDDGTVLGTLHLAGVRDLTSVPDKAHAGVWRDGALLQLYLSQIHDESLTKGDDPCFKKKARDKTTIVVDGKWDATSVAALNAFKKQAEKNGASVATYPDLVKALVDAYRSALLDAQRRLDDQATRMTTAGGMTMTA